MYWPVMDNDLSDACSVYLATATASWVHRPAVMNESTDCDFKVSDKCKMSAISTPWVNFQTEKV